MTRRALRDYFTLTKPSITRLVVGATAAGYYVALRGPLDLAQLVHTLIGTTLVASGTNALNQWWERDVDARMHRTRARPLPAGRLAPRSALAFALLISAIGVAYLALRVNGLTAFLAAATLLSYVLFYTPLKKRTSWNTLVGAVPGALPILGGWTAATGRLAPGGWALFLVLFLWQMPHFFALAWMYRDDYRRGGLRMLSLEDPDGRRTGRQAVGYTVALLAVSLGLTPLGVAGAPYAAGALALGLAFLAFGGKMALAPSPLSARRLFLASVAYLPALLLVLVLDKAAL